MSDLRNQSHYIQAISMQAQQFTAKPEPMLGPMESLIERATQLSLEMDNTRSTLLQILDSLQGLHTEGNSASDNGQIVNQPGGLIGRLQSAHDRQKQIHTEIEVIVKQLRSLVS